MEEVYDLLRSVREELEDGREIDDSLYIGLLNYAQHFGVRSLPDEQLRLVLKVLGKSTVSVARQVNEMPSARILTYTLGVLCDEAYGQCNEAAAWILGTEIVVDIDWETMTVRERLESPLAVDEGQVIELANRVLARIRSGQQWQTSS